MTERQGNTILQKRRREKTKKKKEERKFTKAMDEGSEVVSIIAVV